MSKIFESPAVEPIEHNEHGVLYFENRFDGTAVSVDAVDALDQNNREGYVVLFTYTDDGVGGTNQRHVVKTIEEAFSLFSAYVKHEAEAVLGELV